MKHERKNFAAEQFFPFLRICWGRGAVHSSHERVRCIFFLLCFTPPLMRVKYTVFVEGLTLRSRARVSHFPESASILLENSLLDQMTYPRDRRRWRKNSVIAGGGLPLLLDCSSLRDDADSTDDAPLSGGVER